MSVYFFDTSALKYRYAQGTPSRRIRLAISKSRSECFIAEWSVLEIASALGGHCRGNNLSRDHFERMDSSFFRDLKKGLLKICKASNLTMLRARNLIRFGGIVMRRHLGTADALIATSCLDLALERRQSVIFYLGDWPLYSILKEITAFHSIVKLRYIGSPNHPPEET